MIISADPQLTTQVMNSKAVNTIAKRLWPSMLFLVVISILVMIGLKFIWLPVMENNTSVIVSFWTWQLAMFVVMGFGLYVFFNDARIQLKQG